VSVFKETRPDRSNGSERFKETQPNRSNGSERFKETQPNGSNGRELFNLLDRRKVEMLIYGIIKLKTLLLKTFARLFLILKLKMN
jgi:hypothetical protein